MAFPALPSDWLNYDAKKKLDWFKSKGITADDLTKMGESSEAVEWLINNGLPTGPGILSQGTAEQQQAAVEEAQQISDSVAQQYEAKDRLSDFLDQAASNTGIYEGKQALDEAIANVAGSTSVADKATLYNQLNDNYSDTQIKDAIARVTGRPATDTEWNYLTGAARVQEIAKDPNATVQQKAELYNDLQELFPTQPNQFLNDLINTVAPGQKAEDLKYLAAASDVQDVTSGTVQDKAKVYNNLISQGYDAATAANIIKDATGQAQTAKDMEYLTDAAKVQSLATSTDPNAKADFYNELLKRYDPTAIGNLFTDALGKQESASDMKYLIDLAQQRQTAATTAQTELEKQQAADKAAADRQKAALDAATQAQEAARKAAAGSTFSTGITYGTGMGADRKGTGVDISGESGLRGAYAPYVERMLERASAEADVPFQKYTGSSPLLESARAGIANLTTPAQFLQGSNLAQAAGIGALDYGKYKPTSFTTGTFANPNFASQLSPADLKNQAALKPPGFADGGGVGMGDTGDMGGEIYHAGLDQWGRGGFSYDPNNPPADGKNIFGGIGPLYDPNNLVGGTGQFNGPTPDPSASTYIPKAPSPDAIAYTSEPTYEERVPSIPSNPNLQPTTYGGQNITNVQASYMSPYMQGAIDPAIKEAKRQAEIANQAIGAKAAQAGAFGGSRQGLMESELQRNLLNQIGTIQGQGLQKAYESGLGQFNTEQQRALEAQKLAEQSRQFGSELGLKGLQTSIQAGSALGNIGQQQGYLDLATLKQMADLGQQQQQFDYNEFLRGEKYPYENLTFMRNMLQGLPYNAAATGIDPMSQALSGGISSVYLAQLLGGLGGGSTTSDRRLKTDIQTIGVLGDGLKVYSYRYKSGGPVRIGVMADEVAVLRPQAYIKGGAGDGFDAVDYSKL